jgi:hypothetical protein
MTLDWHRATVLTLAEFDVCRAPLDLGETPSQLEVPSPGRTPQERARIVAEAVEALRHRGLAGPRGPRPVLAEHLRLLATPESSLDVRFRGRALVAGLAARRGPACSLAVRHREEIALLDVPDAAAALVDLIGPVRPGPGHPVTLPVDVLDAAREAAPDDEERFTEALVRRGTPDPDAHALVAMCRGVDLRGQFGATSWRSGRRRRAPHVVGVHRAGAGHYLQARRGNTVTVAPLSRSALLARLDALADLG